MHVLMECWFLKIFELMVRGGGCTVRDTRLGYMFLIGREIKVDVCQYCTYQDCVLKPFIDQL